MRLLNEGPQLLVYGGRSGWVLVGVGLVLAGLAFGVIPFLLYRRGGSASLLVLSSGGLLLLLGGVWALGHRHRLELDGQARVLRLLQGNRFTSEPDTIPFDRIREVGIVRKVYASVSGGAAFEYYVLVLKTADGRWVEIDDQEVDRDLEAVRARGRRIAELVGGDFTLEPVPPG